ncbi:hypothetical protein [Lyngbya aestuarii]|uniref:hypothetical protein n=1 Tax=Lyngbya aestuarii TaxID=118322 RepID=UPI00403DE10F
MVAQGHIEISFPLRNFLGRYPFLYYSLYNLIPKNKKLSVKQNTQLVIEGFPRSANTFAVLAFGYAQPNPVNIAHHMHVPAQVIRAVKWKIPTIVLLRNPKDAVVSFVIRDPRVSIDQALKSYISFYETIYPYKNNYVISGFEEIIKNYSLTIERVNKKFGTDFVAFTPTGKDLENIFQKAEKLEGGVESKVSRPSSTRTAAKKELLQELESEKYSKLLTAAEKIYRQFEHENDLA